jgi:hypothetical protein
LPKQKPELVTVPEQKFFMIKGKGNPKVKILQKKWVFFIPLEGVWDITDEGKKSEKLNKDELIYTFMIAK